MGGDSIIIVPPTGCRGLDPIGDTESEQLAVLVHGLRQVAEGSIRLGILKVAENILIGLACASCRGLDPIGDTESRGKEVSCGGG